jgi:hypothetical protein
MSPDGPEGPLGSWGAVKRETTVSEHARRSLRAVWYSLEYSKTQSLRLPIHYYRAGW